MYIKATAFAAHISNGHDAGFTVGESHSMDNEHDATHAAAYAIKQAMQAVRKAGHDAAAYEYVVRFERKANIHD